MRKRLVELKVGKSERHGNFIDHSLQSAKSCSPKTCCQQCEATNLSDPTRNRMNWITRIKKKIHLHKNKSAHV